MSRGRIPSLSTRLIVFASLPSRRYPTYLPTASSPLPRSFACTGTVAELARAGKGTEGRQNNLTRKLHIANLGESVRVQAASARVLN